MTVVVPKFSADAHAEVMLKRFFNPIEGEIYDLAHKLCLQHVLSKKTLNDR